MICPQAMLTGHNSAMESSVVEKRNAKRFDYHNLTVVLAGEQKDKAEILSIGPTGVFFQAPYELPLRSVVSLGWRDFQFGIIKGDFKIRVRKKMDKAWQYHARFKRLEEPSKTHTLELLKHLNVTIKHQTALENDPFANNAQAQEQTTKEYALTQGLHIGDVQEIIGQDSQLFKNYIHESEPIAHAAKSMLSCIDKDDMALYVAPKTATEHALMRLHMFCIQALLFVQYVEEKEFILFEDMRYVINQVSYLMDEISTLEKNAGFAEPSNPAKIAGEAFESDKEYIHKIQQKIIVLSNKTYDALFSLRNFFKNKKWEEKVQDLQKNQVEVIQAGSHIIIQKFKEKFEVSYDEETYKELGHHDFYAQSPKFQSVAGKNRFLKTDTTPSKTGLKSFLNKFFFSV